MLDAAESISETKTHSPPNGSKAEWNPPIPANRSIKVNAITQAY
jgi:hypothetical protein